MSTHEQTFDPSEAPARPSELDGQGSTPSGGGQDDRRRRWPRRLGVLLLVGALVGGAAWWRASLPDGHGGAAASGPRTATAPVVRRTLASHETVDGTLGFADDDNLVNRRQGTITWLAAEGTTVGRGQTLYKVDDQPVPLLYGNLPFYRRLATGVDDGADVTQLERNLAALGYDPGTVDDHFSSATRDALEQWQEDLGLKKTGVLEPGDVAVAAGALRVGEHKTSVGTPAGQGQTVMTTTSTNREVSIDLDAAKQSFVKVGDRVEITLPSGRTTSGKVSSVSKVAKSTPSGDSAAGGGNDTTTTVAVTVSLDHPKDTGALDQAPVDVDITTATARNALAVPVTALLALVEGGYAVEVQDAGGARHLVRVKLGLFADGLVEVSGSGLRAGTTVVVPE
jgi:peptidoglycan hydrolase-like protein with peptidoglycan-binding domain